MLDSRKYADQKFPVPPGIKGASSQKCEECVIVFAKMGIKMAAVARHGMLMDHRVGSGSRQADKNLQ
jgi:hypothetical protein